MTQEIRRKAREALLVPFFLSPTDHEAMVRLKNFAALVRAAEREACAKVCEDAISSIWECHPEYVKQTGTNVCNNLAAAIRARGQA